MKWSELTWKERKQIYDTVRADNPNVSYLDIKQQFDTIPEYENGKDQDAQAWKINETVRLGLEGRGVSQDSLQHIINRANMQNPVKPYDPLAGSNEHLANLLGGLNKTVGTAATGASILTMGLWNALRMLKLPKAEMLKLVRQGLAKEARTGQNVGNYADYGMITEDLLRNEFDVNNIGQIVINQVAGKDLTKTRNKVGNLIGTALDTNDIVTSVAPSYENGKEGNPKLPVELGLTPGTPEYFARQQRISGRADVVQPEAHLTPAGLVKDVMSFGENIKEGNYEDAAVDAALTLIPVGVRKAAKHLFKTSEVPARVDRESRSVKKKTEADYDGEFSEVLRRNRNIKEYEKEISQSINTAISSNPKVRKLYDTVDSEYGTNYTDAIKRIAMRDMTNRGKYVKYAELPDGIQGHTAGRNIDPEIGPTINNFTITLDPLQYIPGTANHELGHVADQLAGDATKNGYLDYLLDEFNVMDRKELLDKGIRISPQYQMYLFDPLEAKSHMQHLKRSMIQQGKLTDWTDPLTQDKIEAFLFDPRNNVNGMNKIQYNMYRDKSRFVDRMNHLVPVEYAVPLGISGFVNYNTDNNN